MIHIGDIINILKTEYLSGRISNRSKIEFQVFNYDATDRHFQIYYKDDIGESWQVWIPDTAVSLRWSYNFWLKRKKLKKLIEEKSVKKSNDAEVKKLKLKRDTLNEGRHYW